MSPIAVGAVVFAGVFGGALLGLCLSAALPQPHLGAETKDAVRLSMGLVATMTALILGLLIASAKESYDTQQSGVIQTSAKVGFLDRLLEIYGPEAAEARTVLLRTSREDVALTWPDKKVRPDRLEPNSSSGLALYRSVHEAGAAR